MERVSDASGQRGPWTETEHERTADVPERVWGPLRAAETAKFGAHAPVSSVVLRPRLHTDLLEAVKAEVLKDAVPSPVETLDELRARLANSEAFDNPRVTYPKRTKHGHFKRQLDLETQDGGQARRATFAEATQPPTRNDEGEHVVSMRGYRHLYRHHEDQFMCRVMPAGLRGMRDALYAQVHLPPLSSQPFVRPL